MKSGLTRRAGVVGLLTSTAVASLLVAGLFEASASPNQSVDPSLSFRCRLASTKLGSEITVTIRLRTSEPRDEWRVKLFHNGERVYSKTRRTNATGRLKVVRVVENLKGRDELSTRLRNIETGKVCTVSARI
ncbi:MAG: hypothetical protein OEW66_05265 [Actinomycetota bacterium]|nr:hypothetical protein [Actinomycetota bacterium]MDH5313232.1 hypothetical protein [Actinomycetota bacterium]